MKIAGSYRLPFERTKAYVKLHDPALLARCIPGCEALEKTGEDEYALQVKMALAGFSGLFTGKIKIAEAVPPQKFKMIVEGSGKGGFLKGEGLIQLNSLAETTELSYDGDVQVGGPIAAIGQRVIDTTAKMMIRNFFDKLVEEVKNAG